MFHQVSIDEAIQLSFSSSIVKTNGPLDGAEAKEQGMAAAEAGANQEWIEAAENAVKSIAASHAEFTADHIIELLSSYNVTTRDTRALGPVMTRMAKQGIIMKTRETRPCRRKSRHGTDIRVWRSLVF